MARPKKKDSDPQQSMEELLVKTVALYSLPYDDRDGERDSELPSLHEVADQLGTTVLRVRKLLITAEFFSTAVSRQVQQLAAEGNSVEAVMRVTGLKHASVYSYLPYVGLAFNLEQTTVNADRHRLFRKRLKAVEALAEYAGTEADTKYAETTGEAKRLQHNGLPDITFYKDKDDAFASNVDLTGETDTRTPNKTRYLCMEDADARYKGLSDRAKCNSYAGASNVADYMSYMGLQDEFVCLWNAVLAFEGYPFRAAGCGKTPGIKFSYQVKRNKAEKPVGEIIIYRKDGMPVEESKESRKDGMPVGEFKVSRKDGIPAGEFKVSCKDGMPAGEFKVSRKDRIPTGEFKVSYKDGMAVIKSKDGGKGGRSVGKNNFSRKEKTITRAAIELAYRRAKAMGGAVTGPEELCVFGASYLYSMLVRFGVIKW